MNVIIDGRLSVVLCKGCGGTNVACNKANPDLCIECGKQYNRYKKERNKCKISSGGRASVKLQRIIVDYRAREASGYWTPLSSK